MSIGNTKTSGNKGNNFPWQLSVLKILDAISQNTAGTGADHELRITPYKATVTVPGCYTIGDFISRTDIIFVPTGVIISTLWFNETTGMSLVGACIPPIGNLAPFIPPSSVTVSNLPVALGQTVMAGSLSVAIASNQSSIPVTFPNTVRTPSYIQATAPGVIVAGARSVSVYNSGSTPGVWLGTAIAPGIQLSFDAGGQGDTLGAFAYTASATATLEITTIV